jgi:predicted TIM-barrel fold metal-dependent hydrolase
MAKGGFKVFDSDMHIMEPPDLWPRYIEPQFRDLAPRGVTSENVRDLRTFFPGEEPPRDRGVRNSGHNFDRNQTLYKDHADRGWGPDCQLEAMDREGIDAAVLFPTRGLSILTRPSMDPRFANAIARAYNDWLYEFCQKNPTRLLGSGMVSVHDVNDAVAETRRVAKEYGFRSIFLRANIVNGHNWYDPYYEPLWDTLEELELPVGFHEATGSRSRQVGENFDPNFGIRRIYSQPVENMLALGAFLCGGILARHPKLKVAFLEANCSWVPWLVWRADEGYEREGDIFMEDNKELPSEYFKRQVWVSVEPDEGPAKYTIEEFGCDNLVFSTDYPHGDSKYPEAVENFLELPLSDEQKRKILWDNCARFYAVTEPAAVAR